MVVASRDLVRLGKLTGCLDAEVHLWVGGVRDGVAAKLDGRAAQR